MVCAGTWPLDATLLIEPPVRETSHDRSQRGELVEDRGCRSMLETAWRHPEAASGAPRDVLHDLPVGARLSDGRDHLTHPLHAAL